MSRVSFLVDGFNLYHSLVQASEDMGGVPVRWLDLRSLFGSCMYLFGRDALLRDIHYFSALATHRESIKPGTSERHGRYIQALAGAGVTVHLGHFKCKTMRCRRCNDRFTRYEEKETDVAISVMLLELLQANACDIAVLVTGDTDIAPAVRAARRLFPGRAVWCAFPYRRKNKELAQLVSGSFLLRKDHYAAHQLPDSVALPHGRMIKKPEAW